MTSRSTIAAIAAVVFLSAPSWAQRVLTERSYELARTQASTAAEINSNSVTDIVVNGQTIWLGTGKGLARSTDGGTTWKSYYNTPGFGTEDVSAITVRGSDIWVATAHSTEDNGQSLPVGSGLHHSTDGGETWEHFPQPVDSNKTGIDTLYYNPYSPIRALPITTEINNITYDIAATDSAVWITSFAGMVRTSTDKGRTWIRVIIPPDTLDSISPKDTLKFDLAPSGGRLELKGSLNHRAFSVLAENSSTIWIGTAGGINKSTDGGRSWRKFTHQNQSSPISGNFVVALAKQPSTGILWAGTVNTSALEERGISFTSDSGATWKTALRGEFVHGIGFNGNTVYAGTDNGLFRSTDLGTSWSRTGIIYDAATKQRMVAPKFYSIAAQGSVMWFGSDQGIARTLDDGTTPFGSSWTILRTAYPLASKTSTYAYPNPFSPDDEVVRIHYSSASAGSSVSGQAFGVTIRIFDYGMNLVRTLIQNAPRTSSREQDEIWDGRDNNNNQVANGVYFYQVIVEKGDPVWGKIIVLQ
ncbi:MAG: hypothetical protein ACM3Q4_14795 [Acidobacteriota bacterium]